MYCQSTSFSIRWEGEQRRSLSDIPGVKTSGEKLVLMYTCKVCETRSARKISKQAYEKGVVIVRCGKCQSKHLIADNMGVFEDPGWNIQDFLAEKGEASKYLTDDNVFELKAEDIVGPTKKT
jgi:protein import protein ZIM17